MSILVYSAALPFENDKGKFRKLFKGIIVKFITI